MSVILRTYWVLVPNTKHGGTAIGPFLDREEAERYADTLPDGECVYHPVRAQHPVLPPDMLTDRLIAIGFYDGLPMSEEVH